MTYCNDMVGTKPRTNSGSGWYVLPIFRTLLKESYF